MAQMEIIGAKFFEKYNNLKKRKLVEDEEWVRNREVDLRNYQSAAEDLIEELKGEIDRLRTEMSSVQQKYVECKNLLLEESKKSKELSDEIGRLEGLLAKKNDDANLQSPKTAPSTRSKGISNLSSAPDMPIILTNGTTSRHPEADVHLSVSKQMEQIAVNNVDPGAGTSQAHCCRRNFTIGGDPPEGYDNCVFRTLIKFLVGLEFSVDTQTEDLRLLVYHQTSGYSFTLTSLKHDGGEVEFLYHASSLGTLERVALDWMKEDIVFSMAMCHVFFERLSRIIGHS